MFQLDWGLVDGGKLSFFVNDCQTQCVLEMPQEFSPLIIIFGFLEDKSIVHNDFSKLFNFGLELVSDNKSKGFSFQVKIKDCLLERLETEQSQCTEAHIYQLLGKERSHLRCGEVRSNQELVFGFCGGIHDLLLIKLSAISAKYFFEKQFWLSLAPNSVRVLKRGNISPQTGWFKTGQHHNNFDVELFSELL